MSNASVYFTLGELPGKHDEKAIKRELDALPGVLSVSVSMDSGRVAVDYDTTGVESCQIEKQLRQLGYQILESQTGENVK